MSHEIFLNLFLLVLAGFLAAKLLNRYRAYLNAFLSRSPNESWSAVWRRAKEEHAKNENALLEMFGSNAAILRGAAISILLFAVFLWSMAKLPLVAALLIIYVVIGFRVTSNLAYKNNPAYAHLRWLERGFFWFACAAQWPLLRKQLCGKNQVKKTDD